MKVAWLQGCEEMHCRTACLKTVLYSCGLERGHPPAVLTQMQAGCKIDKGLRCRTPLASWRATATWKVSCTLQECRATSAL